MAQPTDVLHWIVASAFCLILAWAAISDIKDRRIPNLCIGAIAVLYLGWAFAVSGVSLASSLEAALIVFLLSLALYTFRVIGAGDSKLVTVVVLFMGLSRLDEFMMVTCLTGGAMAMASLAARPTRALLMFQMRGQGDFGRGIPYGVTIAVAGIFEVTRSLNLS